MLGLTLPILRGALKGKKWLVDTRLNFFLGTYEVEQTDLFLATVRPGDVVYDIGAHFGYYTLLSSTLAGKQGKVFAFEPAPRNLERLRRHVAVNRCANVSVLETALSDHQGVAKFEDRTGSGVGHLSPEGPLEVAVTTLDAIANRLPAPNVMKIDVEGAEVAVLAGGAKLIAASRPAIFLSLHGDDLKEQCLRFLGNLGYSMLPMQSGDYLARVETRNEGV